VAKVVATKACPGSSEELFFAGLLHDFGKIVIHQCFPKHFLIVSALALRGTSSFSDLETKLLGADHAWCGHFVAQNWKIPRMIAAVMGGHHNVPPRRGRGDVAARRVHPPTACPPPALVRSGATCRPGGGAGRPLGRGRPDRPPREFFKNVR
jgi:hypothetical protein